MDNIAVGAKEWGGPVIRWPEAAQCQTKSVSQVEIRYTTLAQLCNDQHRFYALEELISNESTKTSLIALACTQCGSLILHTVRAQ